MNELTHFNERGEAIMVDVTEKNETERTAVACGKIFVNKNIFESIIRGTNKKGDILGTARIAGIMAAKNTAMTIPLCHTLPLTKCTIDFIKDEKNLSVQAVCTVKTVAKTGVEMEALCGVSASLLTIYDMCKAAGKAMEISEIYLLEKKGGKSGTYKRGEFL